MSCGTLRAFFVLLCTAVLAQESPAGPRIAVLCEEEVYEFLNPDNGSGPLWSYGCTPIVRAGDTVYLSQMETGKDIPPLCNTRWRLLQRGPGGWRLVAEAEDYRQREPTSLALGPGGEIFLNVNDSSQPAGVKYGNCIPHLIRFTFRGEQVERTLIHPVWKEQPYFTDHSYRGYAADPAHGQLLMLNIDAKTSMQHACLLSSGGETLATGAISFPIRACYPQAAINNGAVHVLAVGDIVEPVEAWRQYKYSQTQRDWDYVFRILYYTATRDLRAQDFMPPIEIANVEATGGHLSNKDMWVSPSGEAYLLYTEREVASPLLRDKFFPGKSVIDGLWLALVKDGILVSRRLLVAGDERRTPGDARFHVASNGTVYAVVQISGENGGNKLLQIYPQQPQAAFTDIPLKHPFHAFLLASPRGGNAPSDTIDIIGYTTDANRIAYAQVLIGPGE